MKIWAGDLDNQLERINMSVNEENGRAMGTGIVRIRKFQQFSSN